VATGDYDEEIRTLARGGRGTAEIGRAIMVRDVQDAADQLRPLYEAREGRDGFASLEVSPDLAADTPGTISEARQLWAALDRPNVFIKVPATREGLPAIRQLISEGINVNVTLLFGLERYREVAEAYIAGLEDRLAQGQPIGRVASVASFFLSRIDVLLDPRLEQLAQGERDNPEGVRGLKGQVAIASARVAYRIYRELFEGKRFQALAGEGARPQRLLWASTGTKNPEYSDVKYVEALIGPNTVNTLPRETLEAYRDHGNPEHRLETEVDQAQAVLDRLPELGINLLDATQQLEREGVRKFVDSFTGFTTTLDAKRQQSLALSAARGKGQGG
jgi:transaldolase